jgi:hypothetical protein
MLLIHTKYVYIKSTTVYVPSSEFGLSQPLSHNTSECAPPPRTGGGEGAHRLRVRGWGSPNSDDWRKSLALCLLCGNIVPVFAVILSLSTSLSPLVPITDWSANDQLSEPQKGEHSQYYLHYKPFPLMTISLPLNH